jgi:hypothetical protein
VACSDAFSVSDGIIVSGAGKETFLSYEVKLMMRAYMKSTISRVL